MLHKSRSSTVIAALLIVNQIAWAEDEAFQFYEEEAKVVTASHRPVSKSQAPATVYVVTNEDIKNSGAQNIWDALRGVPGVDVIQTRTDQAEISIRGLNKPLNNRTLILVDGKTVLSPFFDTVTPESIPFGINEIDRIEVVEGPASAVYGANAVNGVINIITKTPDQLKGGQIRYTFGERNTHLANAVYGRRQGTWAYKLGGTWRSMNQFDRADSFASQAGKFNGQVSLTPNADSEVALSGGISDLNSQTTDGPVGAFFEKGTSSFARADYRFKKTRLSGYWRGERLTFDQFPALNNGNLDSDIYDAEIEQDLSLPFQNEVTMGASYRRNTATSSVLAPGLLTQDLWALYLEDHWDLATHWALTASARLDRHPYTPLMVSPRGSLTYTPLPSQVFRLSAGTAFRNPTLLENSIATTVTVPNNGSPFNNPPYTSIQTLTSGNRDLSAERMETIEIAHNGIFGPVETSLVGFHYILKQDIESAPLTLASATPPTVGFATTYINKGDISAWGYEAGAKWRLSPFFSTFANYSYQFLHDSPGGQLASLQSPRHKANIGVIGKRSGWTANVWIHWVDKTKWIATVSNPTPNDLALLNAYFLVNARLGYAFSGRWNGFEIGVTAFNLLNHDHYEVLPADATHPGQNGEIVRQRWSGTLSYKF